MSPARARTADAPDTPHPREATQLFGHADAEQNLLEAYRSGRMPHAWLIGGPEGIGKATLAYRMARFVLANPDPDAKAVQTAQSLALFDGATLALHDSVAALLARLPEVDPRALHVIGDSLGRADDQAFDTFLGAIREWLSTRLAYEKDSARLARVATAWETFNQAAADVAVYNLERKPLVFSTFNLLAGLARA